MLYPTELTLSRCAKGADLGPQFCSTIGTTRQLISFNTPSSCFLLSVHQMVLHSMAVPIVPATPGAGRDQPLFGWAPNWSPHQGRYTLPHSMLLLPLATPQCIQVYLQDSSLLIVALIHTQLPKHSSLSMTTTAAAPLTVND